MKERTCDRQKPLRGTVTIEFVLVTALLFVPLILGLLSVGFSLSRSLQVAQLTRDVGRMFVRGVDFALPSNQDLITGSSSRPNMPPLARGLGMAGNGSPPNVLGGTEGNGVLILSVLTRVSSTCNCANAGMTVVTRRIVIGNRTLENSAFGTLSASQINSSNGDVINYLGSAAARATNFDAVMNLSAGEFAFVVESAFNFPDLAVAGFAPNPRVRWRAVF